MQQLASYAEWLSRADAIVADWRVRLSFLLGSGVVLSGVVPRIDYDPNSDRYRAILLGPEPDDWPGGSRFPLLQRAVAQLLGRDERLVEVGVQALDGDELSAVSFQVTEMATAEADARQLAAEIARQYGTFGPA